MGRHARTSRFTSRAATPAPVAAVTAARRRRSLALPALVAAHPLGNFTINHYAEVRVEPERVLLDVVIDQAEIPPSRRARTSTLDGDGSVSDEETEAGRVDGLRRRSAADLR